MTRGEIWIVAGGKDHAGKPRPAVIIQEDSFDATESITVCAFTTDETEAPLFRLPVAPNARNGLRAVCRLMVDKITTVPKSKLGARVGRLDDEDIVRLTLPACCEGPVGGVRRSGWSAQRRAGRREQAPAPQTRSAPPALTPDSALRNPAFTHGLYQFAT